LWSQTAISPPTLDAGDDGRTPGLSSTRISVPSPTGVMIIDGHTGKPVRTVRLPNAPAAGDLAYAAGTGYVIGGRSGVTAYR
jgi:hypothetical protein